MTKIFSPCELIVKKLLQVISADLFLFVFDCQDLVSHPKYENVHPNFIGLPKPMSGILLRFLIWFNYLK